MRKSLRSGLLALSLAATATGCSDYLTGSGVSQDPNNPPTFTLNSLMSSVQANLFLTLESDDARSVCVWMQQCSGQQSQYASVGDYSALGDGDFWYANWAAVYGGGGLIDLRTMYAKAISPSVGDSVYAGIADVLIAYYAGTAADLWGDVPYTQASQPSVYKTPVADPQQTVYDSVQGRLDEALVFLAATGPTNVGPGTVDEVYGGDAALWTALAHTLKARYYMHIAEVVPSAYASALAQTALGIQQGGDYHAFHTTDIKQSNIWYQFFTTAAFGYMAAGKNLVDQLNTAGDPRLAEYFSGTPNNPSIYVGADPGVTINPGDISTLSDTRLAPDFAQPLVTWAENQLIAAEVYSVQGQDAQALANLTAVQAASGVTTNPALTGAALFNAIMTEKYTQDFQNVETWSDWRRTCVPNFTAFPTGYSSPPLKLPIPYSERVANPNLAATDPFAPTWNNPNACP
jgi:hypothetical protein